MSLKSIITSEMYALKLETPRFFFLKNIWEGRRRKIYL